MELKHLEQILAICEAGGLSKAARRLRISQPSLSKSVAKLESELGVQLFNRSDGGVTPTIYGRYIADRSENLLTTIAALSLELKQMARGEAGKLRIGSGPASRIGLLPAVLDAVGKKFPHLQVEAKFIDLPATMRALRAGDLDIAFCTSEVAVAHEDFIRVRIFEDRNITVVRAGHPAITKAALTPAALMEYPIASSGMIPSFSVWTGECSPEQLKNVKAFQSDDYNLIKARALSSDTVARGPRFVFDAELRKRDLVELATTWQSHYECWMLTTRALWQSPVVRTIATSAKAAGKQIVRRSQAVPAGGSAF
jgi:DNA-binding transcriptional LysR family regulator